MAFAKCFLILVGGLLVTDNSIISQTVQDRGRSRISNIEFSGNVSISADELASNLKACLGRDWDVYNEAGYKHYSQKCTRRLMWSRGFLQAKVDDPLLRKVGDAYSLLVNVSEGKRFRWGTFTIDGAKAIPGRDILEQFGEKSGAIANGKRIEEFVFDQLKHEYDERGFIQFAAEYDPEFVASANDAEDGIVNFRITIDEGKRFSIRKIEFVGVDDTEATKLQKSFPLKKGDLFVRSQFEAGIRAINDLGRFEYVDQDRDVEVLVSEELGDVDLVVKIKKA